jgi:XTP/dITP diphosphohydrolase
MRIVLATRNNDKIKEIEAIMASVDVELVRPESISGLPEIVEDGLTLEENALKKARGIRAVAGLCALADDTGLEVDALGGAPGVYSSRYAGDHVSYDDNNRKLLREMAAVPEGRRTARFRCVMALALVDSVSNALYAHLEERASAGAVREADGRPDALVTEGILDGRIVFEPRGRHGFGFDPVFEVPRLGMTLAQLGLEAKNQISHRYRALVEMRELLIRWRLVSER